MDDIWLTDEQLAALEQRYAVFEPGPCRVPASPAGGWFPPRSCLQLPAGRYVINAGETGILVTPVPACDAHGDRLAGHVLLPELLVRDEAILRLSAENAGLRREKARFSAENARLSAEAGRLEARLECERRPAPARSLGPLDASLPGLAWVLVLTLAGLLAFLVVAG
jgi:hypothetical protein